MKPIVKIKKWTLRNNELQGEVDGHYCTSTVLDVVKDSEDTLIVEGPMLFFILDPYKGSK